MRTYRRLSLYRALRPRRFRLYNVGVGKTGTHSIAAIFARHHLAAHEPDAINTITLAQRFRDGASTAEIDAALLARDKRLYLETEASHLVNEFVPNLVRLFPEAKFLLCLRDPWSWLRSAVNQCLRVEWQTEDSIWGRHRRLLLGPVSRAPEEASLAAHSVHSIETMISYYMAVNRAVIADVPADRLLVLRTEEISTRLPEIAAFAGVPPHTLRREASHTYKTIHTECLIDNIPAEYVDAIIEKHCGVFVREWFSKAKTLAQRRG